MAEEGGCRLERRMGLAEPVPSDELSRDIHYGLWRRGQISVGSHHSEDGEGHPRQLRAEPLQGTLLSALRLVCYAGRQHLSRHRTDARRGLCRRRQLLGLPPLEHRPGEPEGRRAISPSVPHEVLPYPHHALQHEHAAEHATRGFVLCQRRCPAWPNEDDAGSTGRKDGRHGHPPLLPPLPELPAGALPQAGHQAQDLQCRGLRAVWRGLGKALRGGHHHVPDEGMQAADVLLDRHPYAHLPGQGQHLQRRTPAQVQPPAVRQLQRRHEERQGGLSPGVPGRA